VNQETEMLDMSESHREDSAHAPFHSHEDDVKRRNTNLLLIRLSRMWSKIGNSILPLGDSHFYFPQRLWIAFSVTNVGLVFFLVLYHFALNAFCGLLDSFRQQMTDLSSQSDSLIAAAPAFLEQMIKFSVPDGLRSAKPLIIYNVFGIIILF
jgi:hypothetical protein